MSTPDIADQLVAWRRHSKLTQTELEQRAGLGHNTVSRIENRNIRSPHFTTVQKLATAMGLSSEELLYRPLPMGNKAKVPTHFRAQMMADLEGLDEEMCKHLYPVWKVLLEVLVKRKGE